MLGGCPGYFLGASLAVGLVELIDHRMWNTVPFAVVPLYFVYRAYGVHLNRVEEEYRRREVLDYLEQGMCVLDGEGCVTLWNDALERILSCPRERALRRSFDNAAPALASTDLTRAINAAATSESRLTLMHVALPSAAGGRIFRVTILPVASGMTLLWQDVTERTRREQALERSEADALGRRRERRPVGMGSAQPDVLCLCSVAHDARIAGSGRHQPAGRVDGTGAS